MLIRKVFEGINRTRNIRIDNKLRYSIKGPGLVQGERNTRALHLSTYVVSTSATKPTNFVWGWHITSRSNKPDYLLWNTLTLLAGHKGKWQRRIVI
jgi:hypothetical protein